VWLPLLPEPPDCGVVDGVVVDGVVVDGVVVVGIVAVFVVDEPDAAFAIAAPPPARTPAAPRVRSATRRRFMVDHLLSLRPVNRRRLTGR
jgi:hypothetical protein